MHDLSNERNCEGWKPTDETRNKLQVIIGIMTHLNTSCVLMIDLHVTVSSQSF